MSARAPALFAAGFLALVAARAAALPDDLTAGRVTRDAVWSPPADFIEAVHRTCDARPATLGACLVEAMATAGAPPAAVDFARRTGDEGWLRDFRDGGVVSVGCAEYPFRANENSVCLLLDGSPPLIDVDDPRLRDEVALRRNPVYASLLRKYPNLAVFPGPRTTAAIQNAAAPAGSSFRVAYALVEGCHACARVGTLQLDFDFDVAGLFRGTRISSVRAAAR